MYDYLSMLVLKLIRISKTDHCQEGNIHQDQDRLEDVYIIKIWKHVQDQFT